MKTVPAGLQDHLNEAVLKLAYCWKITRQDGVIKAFTNHAADLQIGGINYSSVQGFDASAIDNTADLAVNGLDIFGSIDSEELTEADLQAGLYNYAEVLIFMVRYDNPAAGQVILRRGWLGEVSRSGNKFVAELRSLTDAYNQATMCEIYTPTCRANLGDARCQLNLASYTHTGIVTAVTSRRTFNASGLTQATGYFDFGVLTWTTGANTGLKAEIKTWNLDDHEFEFFLPMPYEIAVDDEFSAHIGCNKTKEACKALGNYVNFRGEPDIPGPEALF